MSALDKFSSIDEIIKTVRDELTAEKNTLAAQFAKEKKELEDRLLASELEKSIHMALHDKAVEARAASERFAQKLLTQFSMVERIFYEAREFALQAAATPPSEDAQAAEANPKLPPEEPVHTPLIDDPNLLESYAPKRKNGE
jgi:hypothetical protein